ncbi:MAG: thiamine phosphate synthase [Myxococcales bacterium]|nr:thiamine phosphate synthase [Myxococcales bacterium]
MPYKLPRGLYALIDDAVRPERSLVEKARAALEGGAPVLQLRLETTADRPALEAIRAVVALARPRDARVIVNDRVDLCLAGGADGVHLGADDLAPSVARRLLGVEAMIGATTRSLEDIEQAKAAGADHVGLGPIFPTATKEVGHPPLGLLRFAQLVRASPLPVVGIGGITLGTIAEVAKAGATCAAVAGELLRADDLPARARDLHRAFLAAR